MSKLFTPLKTFGALLILYGAVSLYFNVFTGTTYMLIGLAAVIASVITE